MVRAHGDDITYKMRWDEDGIFTNIFFTNVIFTNFPKKRSRLIEIKLETEASLTEWVESLVEEGVAVVATLLFLWV